MEHLSTKTKIGIKKLGGIIVETSNKHNRNLALSLTAEMLKLGYAPTQELVAALESATSNHLHRLHKEVIDVLRSLKGADVAYTPMYPNFPKQVMDATDAELFWNAIGHYWTDGHWKPDYDKLPRSYAFEDTKFREITLITESDLDAAFTKIVSSNESLSDEDKGYLEWFIKNRDTITVPNSIPYKETMCIVAGLYLDQGKDIQPLIKTATDVLRVITYLNDGDVSLATNTRFASMKRSRRRLFAKILEKVASEEDINRHRNKWTKLFHNLHIGDYSEKLFKIAQKIRNNQHIETMGGKIQAALDAKQLDGLLGLLTQRPGDFSRRIDHVLRTFPQNHDLILSAYGEIVDQISTRVLTQLYGHLNIRDRYSQRAIFPKGSTQNAKQIPSLDPLPAETITRLRSIIRSSLSARFGVREPLGKVYIDPDLMYAPLPSQQRSASEGTFSVARGTRMNIDTSTTQKGTLRFFIYWVGRDIDLSATFHDDNFQMVEQISYTNLRGSGYKACHSGDIVNAPYGASEFIDVDIDSVLSYNKKKGKNIRYVAMNVLVFSGPTFKEHEVCYAGWMTRDKPKSNEIYDPKTVEQKIDVCGATKNVIPVVFDLVDRKAIWVDLSTGKSRNYYWGNNIESNMWSITDTLRTLVESENKMTLYELFELHAEARGELVQTPEEADIVFSLDGDVTPFDINVISSDYI